MDIKVNLTLEQIYKVCCAKCQERVLDLAAKNANIEAVRDSLKQQFQGKKGE